MRSTKRTARLVTATALCGIFATPAAAQDYGLSSNDSTPIGNPSGTTLEGAKSGVFSTGPALNLSNAGTIRGDGPTNTVNIADGGVIFSGGPGTIANSGSISGARLGIATTYFNNNGVYEGRAIGSVVDNSGSIIGDFGIGVRLGGGGSVLNSGYIAGRTGPGADGIAMFAYNDQDTSGLTAIGSVTNLAGAVIEGNRWGVNLIGGGSVDNAGTITGISTPGAGSVLIQGGAAYSPLVLGSLNNSGILNGNVRLLALGGSTVSNSGTILGGTAGSAVLTDSAMSLTNSATASITGAASGVFSSGGAFSVNNGGIIRGNGASTSFSAPNAGVLSIGQAINLTNSGSISGNRFGVTTFGYFTDPITGAVSGSAIGSAVANSGSIIGDNDDGVRLIGGGTVNNSGYIAGRLGAGADGVSMFAYNDQDTTALPRIGTVNNLPGGTIEGNRFGIILSGGGTINNAGTINGGAGALVIQTGFINGKTGAVTNSGSINGTIRFNELDSASVDNGGTILSAADVGIATSAPSGTLSVTNRAGASITGATQGVYSEGAALALDNAGTIRGNGTSTSFRSPGGSVVVTGGPGTISNSGTISGARFGISTGYYTDPLSNAALGRAMGTIVNNSGTIIGDNDDGVRLIGGGSVTNSGYIAGRVTAGADGVSMFAFGDQDTTALRQIGTVTNLAGGTIEGARLGVILSGGGTINNAGTINGGAGGGIVIQTGFIDGKTGSITNSGTINGSTSFYDLTTASLANSGAMTDFVSFDTIGSASLTNSGSITGAAGDAIISNGTLNLQNSTGGVIAGQVNGISDHGPGLTVTNAGTIRGNYGIGLAEDGGPASISNSGLIYGFFGGLLTSGSAGNASVNNSGRIAASFNAAVDLLNGSVTNSGVIDGPIGVKIESNLLSTPTVTNLAGGSIRSISMGAGGIVTNSGQIGGSLLTSSAVTFDGPSTASASLTNNGVIVGYVNVQNLGSLSIVNNGSINSTDPGIWVSIASSVPTTLVNNGQLGGIVSLSNASDTIIFGQGSSFADAGYIDARGGSNSLRLTGNINLASASSRMPNTRNVGTLQLTGGYWVHSSQLPETQFFSSVTVANGTLELAPQAGKLSAPVTVGAGGTLAGSDELLGNLTVNSGGIVSPGRSYGVFQPLSTLTVTGNVLLNTGSTFSVQTRPDGTSDRLVVNGAVTINTGAMLQVLAGIAVYPSTTTTYTILTATGGIAGKFDKPVTDYAYYNASVNVQKKGTVTLNLTPNGKPLPSAATAATFSTALAVESLGTSSPLYQHLLGQSLLGAREAFSALSGSSYARLDALLDDRVGGISLGFAEATSDAPRLSWRGINSLTANTMNSGSLTRRGPISLFMVGGRSAGWLASDGINGNVDTRFLASAAGYRSDRFQALASVASAWHDVSVDRTIAFPGFAEHGQSRYRVTTHRIALEGAYDLLSGAINVAPYGGYAHLMISSPAFSETGGLSALAFQRESRAMDQLKVGLRAGTKIQLGSMRIVPHLDADLERLWGADDQARSARFISGGSEFNSVAYGFNRRSASVDAGLDVAVGPATLTASYRTRMGDRWSDRTARIEALLRF